MRRGGQGRAPLGRTPVPAFGSTLFAYAAGGGVGRHPCTPSQGLRPWNPDLMRSHQACQTYMPPLQHNARALLMLGCATALESICWQLGCPEACSNVTICEIASFAGGLGGRRPAQRGARGAEPPRMLRMHQPGARGVGQRRLACMRMHQPGARGVGAAPAHILNRTREIPTHFPQPPTTPLCSSYETRLAHVLLNTKDTRPPGARKSDRPHDIQP